MRIEEFINLPILSEEAFNAIDRYMVELSQIRHSLSNFRNKDGFLTMGEIKLVNKSATKKEIQVIHNPLPCVQLSESAADRVCVQETIQEYDFDKDGKLNTAEYHQVMLQVRAKVD